MATDIEAASPKPESNIGLRFFKFICSLRPIMIILAAFLTVYHIFRVVNHYAMVWEIALTVVTVASLSASTLDLVDRIFGHKQGRLITPRLRIRLTIDLFFLLTLVLLNVLAHFVGNRKFSRLAISLELLLASLHGTMACVQSKEIRIDTNKVTTDN